MVVSDFSFLRRLARGFTVLLSVAVLSGCATTVQRGSVSRDAPLTTGLDIEDLRTIVEQMVDSMVSDPQVAQSVQGYKSNHPQGLPPVLVQGPIQNKTRSRVDLNIVNNKMRTKLIRSREFQVIDRRNDQAMMQEMIYQQDGGMSNSGGAPQLGGQMNAAYQLNTELIELRTERGRLQDVTYSVKMELIHLQTGFTLWIDELEIGKSRKKALLGM